MRLLYFSRDYTTHDHRFLSALAKTEHQVSYLRLERRGHQLEERAAAAGDRDRPVERRERPGSAGKMGSAC